MKNTPDPTFHRDREKQFIEHVQGVLEGDRLRLDTTRGRRPVADDDAGRQGRRARRRAR